jgi:MFS family permease
MVVGTQESVKKELRPGDYLAVSLLWLAISLHWGALLGILMPSQVERFVDPSQKGTYLGWIAGIGALVSTVMQLAVGTFSDRTTSAWGRRRPYIFWGVLLNTIPLLLFARANSFWALVLAFVGIQVFLNLANGPYQALIPDLVPPERHGKASSYMGLMQLFGQAGGLAIAGLLAGRSSLLLRSWSQEQRASLITVLLASGLLVAMLLTVVLVRERRWIPEPGKPPPLSAWRQMLLIPLRDHPDFAWLIVSRFLINLGFYTATFFLLYYVRDTLRAGARAEWYTFLIMGIATVSGLAGNWPAGVWSDRVSKKRIVYISCGITALAAVLFLSIGSVKLALATAVLFGAGWGAFSAVDWALACNLLPKEDSARWMGIWHFAFTVPQVVAPVIIGPVADWCNRTYGMGIGWRFAMLAIVVYLALGAAALTRLKERPITPASPL